MSPGTSMIPKRTLFGPFDFDVVDFALLSSVKVRPEVVPDINFLSISDVRTSSSDSLPSPSMTFFF